VKTVFTKTRALLAATLVAGFMLLPFIGFVPKAFAAGAQCHWYGTATIPQGINDCAAFPLEVIRTIQSNGGDISDASVCYDLIAFDGELQPSKTPCEYAPFTLIPKPANSESLNKTLDDASAANVQATADRNAAANCNGDTPDKLQQCFKDNPLVTSFSHLIDFLSVGVGVIIVIMLIVTGIQFLTARDNPQTVAVAKKRVLNIVISLVSFLLLYSFMQWLIPGGLF
jgi:hypothetical protein